MHLFRSLMPRGEPWAVCTQAATALFPYVFFTRKRRGSSSSHVPLALISLQAFIFAESEPPKQSWNDTYSSDLPCGCVQTRTWKRKSKLLMCERSATVHVRACPCDPRETSDGVRHVGPANWIEDARKTMTHLPLALIHTVNWTGSGGGGGRNCSRREAKP